MNVWSRPLHTLFFSVWFFPFFSNLKSLVFTRNRIYHVIFDRTHMKTHSHTYFRLFSDFPIPAPLIGIQFFSAERKRIKSIEKLFLFSFDIPLYAPSLLFLVFRYLFSLTHSPSQLSVLSLFFFFVSFLFF